jgi:hypothetical protein
MKALILIAGLWLITVPTAVVALADSPSYCAHSACRHVGAPAPLIGVGLPAVAALGGLLLGARLLKRRK